MVTLFLTAALIAATFAVVTGIYILFREFLPDFFKVDD